MTTPCISLVADEQILLYTFTIDSKVLLSDVWIFFLRSLFLPFECVHPCQQHVYDL